MMREPGTLAFSPDGRYLLLVHGLGRSMVENKRIARLDYATGRRKWLTGPRMASILPSWSPNGRQVAYMATPDAHRLGETGEADEVIHRRARTHLWVVNVDGSGNRRLTHDPRYREDGPEWLPDGRHIRFFRQENTDIAVNAEWGSGKRSLWAIRADGSGLRRLRDLPPEPKTDR